MNYLTKKVSKLAPYVAGMQPREQGWIKLNTNENPYPPSPKVAEALRQADLTDLRLYPDPVSTSLCRAIAEKLNVNAENIFCGNSSDEILALAYQAFLSGKKNVLTPDISYGFYPVWGKMYDVDLKCVPIGDDFAIDAEDYNDANGVILANPNAPTGQALSLAAVEQIVQSNTRGVVIIDEAYIDFADCESAVGLIDKYEHLLVVRTFSKSYALAGLRVGFAVGSEKLLDGLERVKNAFNAYPVNRLSQIGAAAAIRDEAYFNAKCAAIIKTRKRVEGVLNCAPAQANFIFWEVADGSKMYAYFLENKILVRHWEHPRIRNHLRVTIGTPQDMEEFVQCAKKF